EGYRAAEESGLRFWRATAKGLGVQVAKEYEWDLGAYPMLVWSWRPLEFPKGGDERESKTNDSALAVYMLVPYSRIRGPKAVKYIWSEKVPVGTRLDSNMGLTQVRRRCRTATSGSDELREVKPAIPDLVVLDLMLPELDGLEVCRRLRRDTSTASLPIIMLTAKSDEVDRVVGLEVGADDY